MAVIRLTWPDIIQVVFVVINLLPFDHQQKKGMFLEMYNVTSSGSGWKKDIVN